MRLAPKQIFILAAGLTLVLVVTAIVLALRAPVLGIQFGAPEAGDGLRVSALERASPNDGRLAAGEVVTAFIDDGRRLTLDADLLIEEPDQLEQWPRYNAFMARQSQLAAAMAGGTLTALLADGRHVALQVQTRGLTHLPGMFWFQVAVGGLGFLIAAGVWAFRAHDRAALLFALAGFGFLLFASAAAVYSTRELVMDGALVRPLSLLNHFGALFFTASLLSLLWNYPRRLARFPLELPAYGLMLLAWSSDLLQFAPDMAWAQYMPTLLLFAPTFLLAFFQSRHARKRPVEKAALRWFLLSIYLGTGLFAAVILIPVALGVAPVASQGMMFVVFLFMFVGIALGITRYRLFDLDRWWFGAWVWLLGGVAVILLDIVLVSLLEATQLAALSLSLAIVGWAYFPTRQWLMARLLGHPAQRETQALEVTTAEMLAATSAGALEVRWRNVLQRLFEPLELHSVAADNAAPAIADDGQTLHVPSLDRNQRLVLAYPQRAGRLFSGADLRLTRSALDLARHIAAMLDARDCGVREERQRIMRDLHDDLGAKLLSLIHTAGGGEREALARSAMQDMRDILTALEAAPAPLGEALEVLRAELEGRAAQLEVTLVWQEQAGDADVVISARARTNLTRILRETLTNAVRHGCATQVELGFRLTGDTLHFWVSDNGNGMAAETWATGRGMRSMRERSHELGGQIEWDCAQGDGCRAAGYIGIE